MVQITEHFTLKFFTLTSTNMCVAFSYVKGSEVNDSFLPSITCLF